MSCFFITPINGEIRIRQSQENSSAEMEEVSKTISNSLDNLNLIVSSFDGAIRVGVKPKAIDNFLFVGPKRPLNFLQSLGKLRPFNRY